jgi:hypothetical protein
MGQRPKIAMPRDDFVDVSAANCCGVGTQAKA